MSGEHSSEVGSRVYAIVRVDEKGRATIPKIIRERTELKNASYVKIMAKGKNRY